MKFPSITFLILLMITALTSISCGDEASNSTAVSADASATSSAADSSSSIGASVSPSSSAIAVSITASAASGNGYNTITWSSVNGATSYYLYWSTDSSLSTANGTRIANVTSPYTHVNLTNGTKIYYLVSAVSSGTEIGSSSVLNATPAGVSSVTAVSGNGNLTLSWGAVTGATSYNLYYSTSSSITTTAISTNRLSGVSSPYTINGLTNGKTYYLMVTEVSSSVESTPSVILSKAPIAPPSVPTGLKVTTVTIVPAAVSGSLTQNTYQDTISWTAVSGATSYNLYWSISSSLSSSNYSNKINVSSPSYLNDRGADMNKIYYIVTALIENSESDTSSAVNN